MESTSQVANFNKKLQEQCNEKVPLFIAIDEEGGMVARMKDDLIPPPSQRSIANSGNSSEAYKSAYNIAIELKNITKTFGSIIANKNVSLTTKKENPIKGNMKNKILLNLLILFNISVVVFAIQNKDFIFTKEFLGVIENYNNEIGNQIIEYIEGIWKSDVPKDDEIETTINEEEQDTSQIQQEEKTEIYETAAPAETFELGKKLGSLAQPGTIICLNGDLGTGKTVFTQGFAAGLGITEPVSSPTFTIVQVYEEGRLPLYHFDVYRIADVEEMYELGYEGYFFGGGVCLVEWPSRIEEIPPGDCLTVTIEKDLEKGFDYRKITIKEVS